MTKSFKVVLASFIALSLFVIPTSNVQAANKFEEVQPYATVRTVNVDDYEYGNYTVNGEKIQITVRLKGTYLLSQGSTGTSISNVDLTPTVTYITTGDVYNLTAKLGTVKKTINSNSVSVTVNVAIYRNGAYEAGKVFNFTV